LCIKNGFEGIKMDFWSYIFEDSHDLCMIKDKSGYEYRRWWLNELRSAIPDDGYLQSGCDIAMGNPFLGEYFTNYRYGIDIGSGNWENVKTNYLWGMACFATHTGDLIVPNSDSVGLFPGLNETEAMFAINYCLVTHSMVEIAGLLSKEDNSSDRMTVLKKATCNPNNGQDIFFVGYDYRNLHYSVPEVVYFKTPHFSKLSGCPVLPMITVGMFNLDDDAKILSFNVSDFELDTGKYIITDIWSGEQLEISDSYSVEVPPHGSRVFALNIADDLSLYDANVRINNVYVCNDALELETDYKFNDAEFLLSKLPKKVSFDGIDMKWSYKNNKVFVSLPCKGILRFQF